MKILKKITAVCAASASGLTLAANFHINTAAASGVVLNEICAKNTVYAAADGKYYDWIELYNTLDSPVDLSGYGISDDETKPYRFTFPDGTQIGGKQRLMVFCDSKIDPSAGRYTAAFGLSTSGETIKLTDPSGNTVDAVTFGQIDTNVSYGRVADGSDTLDFMADMTPDAPNRESAVPTEVKPPVLSMESGFYDSDFQLNITAAPNTTIYYTLDGSTPDANSNVYTAPITVSDVTSSPNVLSARTDIAPQSFMSGVTAPKKNVDKAFIIRAAAMDSSGNISESTVGTYFVGYQNKSSCYKNMKVISLVTDSGNLFDYEKGIYVLGKVHDDWKKGPEYDPMAREWEMPANYTQKGAEWEREASMQLFDNGSLALEQNVGLRIHGGATRSSAQKSFNVYARSDYGTSKIDFDLFDGQLYSKDTGEHIKKFNSVMLRNGGNDGQYTRFRDKLNQSLVSDRGILTQGMEPCVVFIDGEYWGHYEITEKLDEDFVSAHYGVKKKNVCIVKNEELDAGDAETYAEWEEMAKWVKTTNLADNSAYEELCGKIDIQSFMDYISAEIYYGNADWGENNMAMWKSSKISEDNPYADGRWRFILFDTEYSTNLYGQVGANTNTFNSLMKEECFLADLFKAALKNESFRVQFCRTFMDMANENFNEQKINDIISQLSKEYHDTTIATLDRFYPSNGGWFGGGSSESTYTKEVDSVKNFYKGRYNSITGSLRNVCELRGNLARVTVKNNGSEGDVKINTLSPEMKNGSWEGKYYTDCPLVLSAKPAYGYRFVCWETSDGRKITEKESEITFTSDITITAVYEKTNELPGDVNLDGTVNVADAVMLQKWLAKKGDITCPESAELCRDGKLNALDLVALKRIITGR